MPLDLIVWRLYKKPIKKWNSKCPKMDGLVNLESYMNSNSHKDRRKKAMEIRSPWSSGSGSTSPLPNRLSLFDKSFSGGSTNSLGSSSSPGAEVKTLTNQQSSEVKTLTNQHSNEVKTLTNQPSSLTVPDLNLPPNKVHRSTSPFHFRGRKEKKKLEKQPYCLDEPSTHTLLSLSSQSSVGTSFEDQAQQNTGWGIKKCTDWFFITRGCKRRLVLLKKRHLYGLRAFFLCNERMWRHLGVRTFGNIFQVSYQELNSKIAAVVKAELFSNGQHTTLKNARDMESVSQAKLLDSKGIFKF